MRHQNCTEMLENIPQKSTYVHNSILISQIFESLRMRVDNENETFHNKIEGREIEMRVSQKSATCVSNHPHKKGWLKFVFK